MTPFTVIPRRLFHRQWRGGHPFCPRLGWLRRLVMLFLLLFFSLIIGGYNWLTNSARVRDMAQAYLSEVIGGKVEVHSANLSIFDGLRVDGVAVYVDTEGNKSPDSLIFSAQSFVLKYDPRTLLAGKIEASQIIAQKPRVYLTENLDTPGEWNLLRLGANRARRPRLPSNSPIDRDIPMPEVLLRNARVDISEMRGGITRQVGFMAIDGQLTPIGQGNRYRFEMQGRGTEGVGPFARGEIALNTQQLKAELHNFDFNRDLRSMLPAEVRAISERHALSGTVDIPELSYTPPHAGQKAQFRVDMELRGVSLSVPPIDWMGAQEVQELRDKRPTLDAMRELYSAAGFGRLLDTTGAQAGKSADDGSPAPKSTSAGVLNVLSQVLEPAPITLRQGAGRFIFTDAGILVQNVTGKVEGNDITVNGHIDGYGPDAPAALTIRSPQGQDIFIPPDPHWARTLPRFVRDIYQDIRPTGTCRLMLHIDRLSPGKAPIVSGQVDIVSGNFNYRKFAYPVRDASGTIAFGPDPARGGDFVKIINFRGHGIKGGPNENLSVVANGEIGPLGPQHSDPEVHVIVTGTGVSSEPALAAAFPWEISNTLNIFDADHQGKFPQYHGNFVLNLIHSETGKWTYDTDVDLDDMSGRIVGFPYPLDHLHSIMHVRDGYVDIEHASMRKDGVELDIDGRVIWGEGNNRIRKLPIAPILSGYARQSVAEPPEKMDLQVIAKNYPINSDLVNAIPVEHRYWLQKLGIGGTLDAQGRITLGLQPDQSLLGPAKLIFPQITPRPFNGHPEQINFDLDFALRNGTFWPADGTFSVSNVNGELRLTRDGIEVQSLHGRRGNAVLTADGSVQWTGGHPQMAIHAAAKDLLLDSSLYGMLPEDARHAWDEVQPQGMLDAELSWKGNVADPAERKGEPGSVTRSPIHGAPSAIDPTAIASADGAAIAPPAAGAQSGFYAVLKPTAMTCTIRSLPLRMDNISGSITIDHGHVTLADVKARHNQATIAASGTGDLEGQRPMWDLHLSGKNFTLDNEFRKSVPATLQTLIDALKLHGNIDFEFSKLLYRGEAPNTAPSTVVTVVPATWRLPGASATTANAAVSPPRKADRARQMAASDVAPVPATTTSTSGPDIDLSAAVDLHNGTMDAGVPMEKINGRLKMDTVVRQGKLAKLDGDLDFSRFTMASREVTGFHATLSKPIGTDELNLDKVQASIADGQLAGQLHMVIPDEGASRYTLGLVLRNADVQALAGDAEKDLSGRLTASVSLEGTWGEATMRRGRGDVTVSGRELYRMPLILGLLQVTNLSLPIGSPFKQGLAKYSVEGQRVNFERIDLKSDNMLMTGSGYLNFANKQVRMTFTTDNPAGFKIPFLNDIWQGARQELFKISIKGTIQQPKVEANSFGTVTTTIDEVFKGDAKKEK